MCADDDEGSKGGGSEGGDGGGGDGTDDHYPIYGICLLISSVFLFTTLVFYLLLPELRDLQGKCVCFTVLSLLIGNFSLAMIQLPNIIPTRDHALCVPMGKKIILRIVLIFNNQ